MSSAETIPNYVERVNREGYVALPIAMSGADIDPLFTSFRAVLNDIYEKPTQHGEDVIAALNVAVPGREGDSTGFIFQRRHGEINPYEPDSAPATDSKDVFHFTPRTMLHAREHLRTRGGMPQVLRQLLTQCVDLHFAARDSLRPVFKELGVSDYVLSPQGYELNDVHHLRIIRYLASEAEADAAPFKAHDALAQLHFDRSKFTAAIWESSSGLVGTAANNLLGEPDLTVEKLDEAAQRALHSPIAHHSGEIKLFAGAGYNRLPGEVRRASGNLQPLLHGVIDDHPGEERDAVVLFMNETILHTDCSVPPKTETSLSHLRQLLQEQER